LSLSSGGLQARGQQLGLPRPRFCRVPDPVKSKPCREGDPSITSEPPRESQIGEMLGTQRHQRERLQREPRRVMWTHQRMSGVGCKRGRSGG
jgi:hypothetical protein